MKQLSASRTPHLALILRELMVARSRTAFFVMPTFNESNSPWPSSKSRPEVVFTNFKRIAVNKACKSSTDFVELKIFGAARSNAVRPQPN